MSTTPSSTSLRLLAPLVVLALAAGLLAPTGVAHAQAPGSAHGPPAAPASAFADEDAIAQVHRTAVYELVAAGVVRGCAGGNAYCPADGVTREQMASFIGRALGLAPVNEPRFDDVGATSTHGGYVAALADAGITAGCDAAGSQYCPRQTVTREQMATFLTRAYQLLGVGAPSFDDVGGGIHAGGIAGVAAAQVTTGCTTDTFCPRDTVTREQMASFIARAMGLLRDSRGCPTTLGPDRLSTGAPALTEFGTAAEGFPVSSAERLGDKLYVFSFDLSPSRLVVYDLNATEHDEAIERIVQIPNGRRTWAVHAPDPDGNLLYFGQDAPQNNLYRYDAATGRVQQVASITGITEMWDLTSDDQGRIYIGTSNHRTVFRYTPATGGVERLSFVGQDGQSVNGHVTQLAWDDGVLFVGTGRTSNSTGDDARLVAIDTEAWTAASPATAYRLPDIGSGFGVYDLEVSDALIVAGLERWPYPGNNASLAVFDRPTDTQTPGVEQPGVEQLVADLSLRSGGVITPPVSESAFTSVAIGPDLGAGSTVHVAGRSKGTIYDLAPHATQLTQRFDEPPAPESPTRRLLVAGTELIGAAAPATIWRDPIDSLEPEPAIYNLVDAGAPSQPIRPQSLAAGGGHIAVGSNNSITLHQPAASKRITAVPGEPKVMHVVDGNLIAGLYPTATLRHVTLADPYPGETIGDWDNLFGRPTDIHHDREGSGQLLLSAQVTTNSSARGAVVNFGLNPPSLDALYEQPAAERGASAITTWGSQTIVGGTSADGRVAARPTASTSGEHPLWSVVPVPGGGNITGLVTVDDHVHGMTEDGRWFTLDPAADGHVTNLRRVFGATTGRIAAHGDWVYAVTRDCLVAIDTVRMRAETLHGSLGANTFGPHTLAIDVDRGPGVADVYVIRGNDLVRLRHQQR